MTRPAADPGLTLAELVQTKRVENAWTMESMAQAMDVTKQYVHQIERGVAMNPSALHIQKIAKGLGVAPVIVLYAALRSQGLAQ